MDEKRVHSTIRGPDYRGRSKQSSLSQQRSGRHRLDQKQDRNISEEPWFERHCDCRALRLRRQPERKEVQVNDILAARELVKSWYPECTVLGLWVNDHWNVTRVD